MPRATNKSVKAYPLFNSGSFTWNRKGRELVFMRAGHPQAPREDMRQGSYFRVAGDDIKLLYQVLHEHSARLTPSKKGKPVYGWREQAPPGPDVKTVSNGKEQVPCVEPHKNWKKVSKRGDKA
jgi:hypothetical protein